MDCKHLTFDVRQHDYCPECGETDVRRIIDEREVARLQSRNDALEAEVARLRAAYDAACDEGYRLSNNLHVAEAEVERLRTALANAEVERDDYWGTLDEIADGVADPEWTAREALGRNE